MEAALRQPTMELDGIRLRPLRASDAAAWHGYLSDPRVTELTSYPIMSAVDVESMLQRVMNECGRSILEMGGSVAGR